MLAAGDNELSMGDNNDISCHWRLLRDEVHVRDDHMVRLDFCDMPWLASSGLPRGFRYL